MTEKERKPSWLVRVINAFKLLTGGFIDVGVSIDSEKIAAIAPSGVRVSINFPPTTPS